MHIYITENRTKMSQLQKRLVKEKVASCQGTGRPGVLQSMGSQRVGHD